MFDLGINDFAEEQYSSDGIIVIDSEPTYGELLNAFNELYSEYYFLQYDKFRDEFVNGFDMFSNAFIACEYIQQHGIDDNISELIGNEGLLTNVKNVIVKFAQWLFNMISKFVKWIASLFTNSSTISYIPPNKSNYKVAAHKAAISLIRGSKSDRAKIKKDIDAGVAASKLAPNLKEGHNITPGSRSFREIFVPKNRNEILETLNILNTTMANLLRDSDQIWPLEKMELRIKQLIEFLKSEEEQVCDIEAADYVWDVTDRIFHFRELIMISYEKLKKLPKLKPNASEAECANYIQQVEQILQVESKKDDSEKSKTMKQKVQIMFSLFRSLYKIEGLVINSIKGTVTVLYGCSFYRNHKELFSQKSGAVDVRVKIPADLMNRIREAWKCPQLTINRLIISSTRVDLNYYGAGGYAAWRSINGALKTGKNIYIAYQRFKSLLGLKELLNREEQYLKDNNINSNKYYVNLDPDRVKELLLSIVHESRHIYQYIKQIYTKVDLSKETDTHAEYLKLNFEMDARKAAMNFEFKDSDVKWAEMLLNSCFEQEKVQVGKHWNFH